MSQNDQGPLWNMPLLITGYVVLVIAVLVFFAWLFWPEPRP